MFVAKDAVSDTLAERISIILIVLVIITMLAAAVFLFSQIQDDGFIPLERVYNPTVFTIAIFTLVIVMIFLSISFTQGERSRFNQYELKDINEAELQGRLLSYNADKITEERKAMSQLGNGFAILRNRNMLEFHVLSKKTGVSVAGLKVLELGLLTPSELLEFSKAIPNFKQLYGYHDVDILYMGYFQSRGE